MLTRVSPSPLYEPDNIPTGCKRHLHRTVWKALLGCFSNVSPNFRTCSWLSKLEYVAPFILRVSGAVNFPLFFFIRLPCTADLWRPRRRLSPAPVARRLVGLPRRRSWLIRLLSIIPQQWQGSFGAKCLVVFCSLWSGFCDLWFIFTVLYKIL